MRHNEIQWFYPSNLNDVQELLEQPGIYPCAGNTFLLKAGLKKVKGLIYLGDLGLDYFRSDGQRHSVGATLTFNGLVRNLIRISPDSVLIKSLRSAATCPLRNRITVGGSVASFPRWSDLMGPLIALDASLELIGSQQGQVKVTDYLASPQSRKGTLITEINYSPQEWQSSYFRCGRTVNDYSLFNFTILWQINYSGQLEDIRIVLVGTRKKFRRIVEIEDAVRGLPLADCHWENLVNELELSFNQSTFGRANYLEHMARCELVRALSRIGEIPTP